MIVALTELLFLVHKTADWVSRSPTKAVSIETAAYAVLAFICMGDMTSASSVVNWLNAQRGLGGGFVSTQVQECL